MNFEVEPENLCKTLESVRKLIGARNKDEIVFTSCGSESNALAVHFALNAFRVLTQKEAEQEKARQAQRIEVLRKKVFED